MIKQDLQAKANPKKAIILQRFFKTGKGEYGEGDVFLGITVPDQRIIAKQYKDLSLEEIQELLESKIHEYRLTGLLILTYKTLTKEIYDFYLKNTKHINNWDLVDLSAPRIIGKYLLDNNLNREILYKLSKSKNLWEKRISIVSCWWFIRNNDLKDTLKIAETLLNDEHDLIHKAVGWMLREVGKKNQELEETFLEKYHKVMPKTMLRYSIEKFNKEKRKYYMKK